MSLISAITDYFHHHATGPVMQTAAVGASVAPFGENHLDTVLWLSLSVSTWIRLVGFFYVLILIFKAVNGPTFIKYLFNIAKDYIKGLK